MKLRIGIPFQALFFCLLIAAVAEAGVSVLGGLTHQRNVEVGESYSGVISIQNTAEEPQEVRVYQTDYLFFCDGTSIYGEPGETPRSNAEWISFSPHSLVIPPKTTSAVNYTVKVPNDESLVGTYWSMFMVEGVAEASPQASKPEEGKVKLGIVHVFRFGIQMVAHIGDTGGRELKFLNTKLLKEKEGRILQVDIENVGERWLRPVLWAELYDGEGNYIGKFEAGKLRIYPDTSVRYRVDLSQVPKGKYKALVVADCGGDDLFGATYNLELEK